VSGFVVDGQPGTVVAVLEPRAQGWIDVISFVALVAERPNKL
jgi:hypothetical protein